MTATPSIRPITATDQPAWQPLYEGYHLYYERPGLPQAFYDQAFARLVSGDPRDFRGLVAADAQDRLLGLVHWVYHPNLWRPEGVCYLMDLFTVPQARGQGVGRALIEAVYAAADADGVPAVYWLTQEFNYAGRALYDKVAERTPFIRYSRRL